MKTKFTLFFAILLAGICFAQDGINYKAIIKDGGGVVVSNEVITVRLTIIEGVTNVYREDHNPLTDDNGLVILNIGDGTPLLGTFGDIDWTADDHFLNVQVNTGSGLTNLGTTQFSSVPYSLATSKIELPYFDRTAVTKAAFHVHNDFANGRFGIAGSVGVAGETLPPNNAGVMGVGSDVAHGVYGLSKDSFLAGVQGVSESEDGYGVIGYGFGDGVGGHFYTTASGIAALTTGTGNVGIGIDEPEMKLHMGGDLFIQTNLGEIVLGFPNNGNQWQFGTQGQGATLQLQSKPNASNNFTTQFKFEQTGEFKIGTTSLEEAWLHVEKNSTINKPHILLEEVGNDYARIGFENTSVSGSDWQIAALPSQSASTARVNFYYRNNNGADNKMTLLGNGKLGIDGTPSSKLHVFQKGQSLGLGLAFDDGTANEDWDITHGFGLRFHYGATLKGLISATTGAYIQGSDVRLKENINDLSPVLDKVVGLNAKSYTYIADTTKKKSIGVIAQDVQRLFPEVVHYSEVDDTYGVDYSAFGVIAIKAIQEQQAIISAQETKIENMSSEMENINLKISQLEALLKQ